MPIETFKLPVNTPCYLGKPARVLRLRVDVRERRDRAIVKPWLLLSEWDLQLDDTQYAVLRHNGWTRSCDYNEWVLPFKAVCAESKLQVNIVDPDTKNWDYVATIEVSHD